MTASRDLLELRGLLHAQKETYALLRALSEAQEKVFTQAGPRALMKVIGRKQLLIAKLDEIALLLEPYTSQWSDTLDALPAGERRAVSGVVEETASILRALIESEQQIEATVSAARDRTGAEIRAVSENRAAVKAYSEPVAAAAGRFYDREQ